MNRAQYVQHVESFIGTEVLHQGRSRRGIDCGGLLYVTATDAGFEARDVPNYERRPNKKFEEFLDRQMTPISPHEALPGDWVFFWMDEEGTGQHVACVVGYDGDRPVIVQTHHVHNKVVRQTLPESYEKRLIKAYRIHELEDEPWQP